VRISKEKSQNRAGQLDRTPLATPPVGCVRAVDGAACGAEGDHDLGPRGECLPRLSFDPPPPPARLAPGTGRQAGSQETSRPNGYRVITGLHPSMPDRWGTRARAVRCCCVGRSSDRSKMPLGLLRVKTVGGWPLPSERMERGRNPCRAQAGAAPIHRPGGRRCMHACVDGDARARGDVHG
jgi:hypothetical protein